MASFGMRLLAALLVVTAPGLAAAQPIEVADPAVREVVARELPPGTVLGPYAPERRPRSVPLLTAGTSVLSMMATTGLSAFIAGMATGGYDLGCPPTGFFDGGPCGENARKPYFMIGGISSIALAVAVGLPMVIAGGRRVRVSGAVQAPVVTAARF